VAVRWNRSEQLRPPAAKRKSLRKRSTEAERRLWNGLRARQLEGFKFRRQYAFGPYVLDFYCPSQRLAIEVDGDSHASERGEAEDALRTEYLSAHGVRVIRFTNLDVLQAVDVVLEAIVRAVKDPDPVPSGEREPC
jgi:very-short-patch-repair endonuclease